MATCQTCQAEIRGDYCPTCDFVNMRESERQEREDDARLAARSAQQQRPLATTEPTPPAVDTRDGSPAGEALASIAGMGASGSGKTSTALGLAQAVHIPFDDGLEIRAVLGKELAELTRQGNEILLRDTQSVDATTTPRRWQLSIDCTRARRHLFSRSRSVSANIDFFDGPGGAMYVQEADQQTHGSAVAQWQRTLVEHARSASAQILCIDANGVDTELVVAQHPAILAQMVTSQDGARLRGDSRVRPALRAERYLILFTKIDILADRLLTQMRDGRVETPSILHGSHLSSLRPVDVANAIDPAELALEHLGPAFLKQLLDALPRAGQLAVGLSSAWGFDPQSGEPLCHADGRPNRLDADSPLVQRRNWTPYGLRDALRFLLLGEVAGTLEPITLRRLYVANAS